MKKLLLLATSAVFLASFVQAARADTPTVPTIVSFTMSPNSVDIATANTTVTLDLVVTNPTGIFSTQDLVTISDGGSNTIVTPIVRVDSPVNPSLQTVEFKGTYTVANTLPTGVYTASAAPIIGSTSTGAQGYSTQVTKATTTSTVIGATNSLLVRNGGYLNFAYPTFVGPSFNSFLANKFVNPKYNSVTAPIWKIGEIFSPSDYYELEVPSLLLQVKSNTPATCTSTGTTLNLVGGGVCQFTVYTAQTLDYQYREDVESVNITAARTKPTLNVGTIATQSSSTLPLSVQGPTVYSPTGALVIPTSSTPTVCYPVGSYITIISGGICTLNYSTLPSATYLASDSYPLTFQITRKAQTISFVAPEKVTLTTKSIALSGMASSGLPVTFQSTTPSICSVTGNSVNFLAAGNCTVEADQAGNAITSPVSTVQRIEVTGVASSVLKKDRKSIVCTKNGKQTKFAGNKCPVGYKAKKYVGK